ncbi:MAG: PD40 domain-containing protein [Prevotella sp.]|nr:PD40 domain-containing protein [Prevotella sp.]
MKRLLILATIATLLVACGKQIPQNFKESDRLPNIYPDYTNVTVPINTAPLAFQIDGKADDVVARLTAGTTEIICGGSQIQPDADDWKQLTEAAKGNAIKVEVYVEQNDGWTRYKPFNIFVSPDSIDAYISYRLIPPSYVTYEELTINQRCLENYDESIIYDNMLCSEGAKGQCINCHNYQQYNPDRMQFHARQNMGGTVIAYDGNIKKINMRNDSILSAGVYPTWHPWLPLIVYSTNMTGQIFHSTNPNKIEVFDSESDLIAYDVEKNEVTNIENDPAEMECFPFWAPDGKTLYYCSAHFEYSDTVTDKGKEFITRTQEAKYNLYKKRFNPETMQFGPRELVFAADSLDKSATLPRISPDGRYLMFTVAKYGVFHIWHHDADLWMLDLQTGEVRNMEEINSADTESYHSWSSNGRWVVFSSRRYDSNYTRPFIAHIDKNGHGSKPFELPCANPDYHRQLLRSYNVPEFMKGPVTIKPQRFADALKQDAEPVKYVNKLSK